MDENTQLLSAMLKNVRDLYPDIDERRLSLERQMLNNAEAREVIAQFLLERGPDCVRVPLVGEVS